MPTMLDEINEIPEKSRALLEKKVSLPDGVPYIGMGSSYFAALAPYYAGSKIVPQIASEYANYLSEKKQPLGVLISQSGESSEVVWCIEQFNEIVTVVNETDSALGNAANAKEIVSIDAGPEEQSSSKTYVNTVIALYCGLGFEVAQAVDVIEKSMDRWDEFGKKHAAALAKKSSKGYYVIGSGPNIATAYQGALILSEASKLPFIGMPMSQYDHGPKETAKDTVVIVINVKGPSYDRTKKLTKKIKDAGAHVVEIEENIEENISPITTIMPINFLTHYLAKELGITSTFSVGGKVTRVE